VGNAEERQSYESATAQTLRGAGVLIRRLSPRIWERHAQGR
jgi:hypothetical protein